jgi:hypothetical protein
MKIKELIEQLQKFDSELPVVVDGYETGFDYVYEVYESKAFKYDNKKKASYDGELAWLPDGKHPTFLGSDEKIAGEVIDVVCIPRNS